MRSKPVAAKFGDVVREVRLQRGLSQEELAGLCGLHRTYVGCVERGEKTVTLDTATRLAHALGQPLWRLLQMAEAGQCPDE